VHVDQVEEHIGDPGGRLVDDLRLVVDVEEEARQPAEPGEAAREAADDLSG
jgi:hypothetical protein